MEENYSTRAKVIENGVLIDGDDNGAHYIV